MEPWSSSLREGRTTTTSPKSRLVVQIKKEFFIWILKLGEKLRILVLEIWKLSAKEQYFGYLGVGGILNIFWICGFDPTFNIQDLYSKKYPKTSHGSVQSLFWFEKEWTQVVDSEKNWPLTNFINPECMWGGLDGPIISKTSDAIHTFVEGSFAVILQKSNCWPIFRIRGQK